MDAVSLLLTVKDVIAQAYSLYQQHEQSKENRGDAFLLWNKLRHVESRLKQFRDIGESTAVVRSVLTDIESDFTAIRNNISQVLENSKSRTISSFIRANDNHVRLHHALDSVTKCLARLETHGLIVDTRQCFSEEICSLRKTLVQCMSDASASLNQEFKNSMGVIHTALESITMDSNSNLPSVAPPDQLEPRPSPNKLPPNFSSSTISSVDLSLDSMEVESVMCFSQVPDSIQKLVADASRSGTCREKWRTLLNQVTSVWSGWRIPSDQLRYQLDVFNCPVQLGRGAAGVIFAASYTPACEVSNDSRILPVAVKHIDFPQEEAAQRKPDLLRCIFLQLSLNHNCILRTYGVCWPEDSPLITDHRKQSNTARVVMERMTHSVADAQAQGLLRSKLDKTRVLVDVSAAVRYLHDRSVVHRDLKPENILLRYEDGELIGFAKLTDFGCSRRMHHDKVTRSFSAQTQASGTTLYLPPEVLRDASNCRTRRSWDVWAYGMLLCSVLAPEHRLYINPWNASNLAQSGELGRSARAWASNIEDERTRTLATRCLQEAPEHRPTMEEVDLFQLGRIGVESLQAQRQETSSVATDTECSVVREGGAVCLSPLESIKAETGPLNTYDLGIGSDDIDSFVSQGFRYIFGTDAAPKRKAAAALFRHAAASGSIEALRCLGLCFEKGAGVGCDLALATSLFDKAAEQGSSAAMCNLGTCYRKGVGVEQNMERALVLYKRAAATGCGNGIRNMAFCFETGTGVVRDVEQAMKLYHRAADAGNMQAFCRIAYMHRSGIGVHIDCKKAVSMYEEAAQKGCVEGVHSLAFCFRTGTGLPMDKEKALKLYQEAADGGSEGAQCNVAYCFRTGTAVTLDEKHAFELYKDAAEAGSAEGKRILGFCYREGIGVDRDEDMAAVLSQAAADGGNGSAMCSLAHCYRTGMGVQRDLKRAVSLYRQAGEGGDGPGLCRMGVCYQTGLGLKRNAKLAVRFFKRAADAGNVEALRHLGNCYLEGSGVDIDEAMARCFFEKASAMGDNSARRKLKRMGSRK